MKNTPCAVPRNRSQSALLALCLILGLAGCGGGGATGETPDELGPVDPLDITVDADNGSDQGNGSPQAPFKTLTTALANVGRGGVIKVRSGRYDAANGEIFPLVLPTRVHMLGLPGGERPLVEGAGSLADALGVNRSGTMVPGINSTIEGLRIRSPNAIAVAAGFVGSKMLDCVIDVAAFGIVVLNDAFALTIAECEISSTFTGLSFEQGGAFSTVESCDITGNIHGVVVATVILKLDLGGGPQGSKGDNTFADNAEVDLSVFNGASVIARNNFWDQAPPKEQISNNPSAGTDISRRGSQAIVDSAGAKAR